MAKIGNELHARIVNTRQNTSMHQDTNCCVPDFRHYALFVMLNEWQYAFSNWKPKWQLWCMIFLKGNQSYVYITWYEVHSGKMWEWTSCSHRKYTTKHIYAPTHKLLCSRFLPLCTFRNAKRMTVCNLKLKTKVTVVMYEFLKRKPKLRLHHMIRSA